MTTAARPDLPLAATRPLRTDELRALLLYFGITLAAFRIAGGLILFGIGMGMLQKSEAADHATAEARPSGQIADDISIVPLAIPFISGPGAIATAMILTSARSLDCHVLYSEDLSAGQSYDGVLVVNPFDASP
jgi:hypothetical protein